MFKSFHSCTGSPTRSAPGPDLSRRSLLKYVGAGTAALGAAPFLAACGGSAAGAEKFSIASFPGDVYLFDKINEANKDFAKHDLEVPKLVTPQSGVQALQLLVAGGVQGYASDTLLLLSTFANSTKGKRPVITGFRTMESTYGIVVGKDGDWPDSTSSFEERMQSLKGKKVGVSAVGAGGDTQLRLALELAGMEYDDVTHLATGPTATAAPNLDSGRIDAYVTVQWTSARLVAEQTGGSVLLDFSDPAAPDLLRNQAVAAVAVREDTAKEKPEVVKNWMAAQSDANDWILANQKKAAQILNTSSLGGKMPDIASAYIEHYASQVAPAFKPQLKASEDVVQQMIDVAVRVGTVEEGAVTFKDIVPEFARA